MAERVVRYLIKKHGIKKDEAEKYVSEVFNTLDSITKEKGYKPFSEKEKTEFTMSTVKVLENFAKAIAKELNKQVHSR